MVEYKVYLSEEADEGLKKGIYEFTAGGIRNVETKKMVQLFRKSADLDEETAAENTSCVQMAVGLGIDPNELHEETVHQANRVLQAIAENNALARQAIAVGYLNYDITAAGFKAVTTELNDIRKTIEYGFNRTTINKYNQYTVDLMALIELLADPQPAITPWDVIKTLNEISSYLHDIVIEYENHQQNEPLDIDSILEFTHLFTKCCEACKLFCIFRNANVQSAYDKWHQVIYMVFTSQRIRYEYRKRAYLYLPKLQTSEIEMAAKLQFYTLNEIMLESHNEQAFVLASHISREEYLQLPDDIAKKYTEGKYLIGNVIDDRERFVHDKTVIV